MSAMLLITTRANECNAEEATVETHFKYTFTRNECDRFIVRLFLKQNPNELGNSLGMATKRLLNLERKFEQNKD